MSIACHLTHAALAVATTLPAVTPPAVDPAGAAAGEPAWLGPAYLAWAALGLAAAAGLGAFRRQGIVGPERVAPGDSAWGLLGVLFGGFVALLVGTLLANGLILAGLRVTGAHPGTDVVQLAVGGTGELLAVGVVVVLARERAGPGGLRRLGLAPAGLPAALAGGAAALFILFPLVELTGSGVQAVYRWLHLQQALPHPVLQMMRQDRRPALAVAAVFTASVVAPLAEELAFRGLLQTTLGRAFNRLADRAGLAPTVAGPDDDAAATHTRPAARWAAVAVTSLAFAAVHGEPAFLAPIFVLSVGLGFVYERSGNLWMNVVTHSLFNTAQIVVFLNSGG